MQPFYNIEDRSSSDRCNICLCIAWLTAYCCQLKCFVGLGLADESAEWCAIYKTLILVEVWLPVSLLDWWSRHWYLTWLTAFLPSWWLVLTAVRTMSVSLLCVMWVWLRVSVTFCSWRQTTVYATAWKSWKMSSSARVTLFKTTRSLAGGKWYHCWY